MGDQVACNFGWSTNIDCAYGRRVDDEGPADGGACGIRLGLSGVRDGSGGLRADTRLGVTLGWREEMLAKVPPFPIVRGSPRPLFACRADRWVGGRSDRSCLGGLTRGGGTEEGQGGKEELLGEHGGGWETSWEGNCVKRKSGQRSSRLAGRDERRNG